MLVLSRRIGEEIVIGRNVRVRILSVEGNRVRLGIVAPPKVAVDRKEVHDLRAQLVATDEAVGRPDRCAGAKS